MIGRDARNVIRPELWKRQIKAVNGVMRYAIIPFDFSQKGDNKYGEALKSILTNRRWKMLTRRGFVKGLIGTGMAMPLIATTGTGSVSGALKKRDIHGTGSGANPENSTFQNFVVAPSNEAAWLAGSAVGNDRAIEYNPLYIHGWSGMGKTHLLYAIKNQILLNRKGAKAVYVSAKDFMREYADSIRSNMLPDFREKFMSLDTVLIDDIEHFACKDKAQEELLGICDALVQSNGQIVMTGKEMPGKIYGLNKKLRGFIESGLITDIKPPGTELRAAILHYKAAQRSFKLSEETAFFVVSHMNSSTSWEMLRWL